MSITVFVTALALLALPAVTYRAGRRVEPVRWARLVTISLLSGYGLLVIGLVLASLPTVFSALGFTEFARLCARLAGHGLPGGAAGGWIAAAGAAFLIGAGTMQAASTIRGQRRMSLLAVGGIDLTEVEQCRVVEIECSRPFAVALRDARGRIVVTSRLADVLSKAEFDAVVRHEAEHVRRRHWQHLVLAAMLLRSLGWLPLVKRSVGVLRLALERIADEAAAGAGRERKAIVRSALAKLATANVAGTVLPAFAADAPVMERIRALDGGQQSTKKVSMGSHLAVGVVMGPGFFSVGLWMSHAHYLATNVLCPI